MPMGAATGRERLWIIDLPSVSTMAKRSSSRSPRFLLGTRQHSYAAHWRTIIVPSIYVFVGFLLARCLDTARTDPSPLRHDAVSLLSFGRSSLHPPNNGWRTIQVYAGPIEQSVESQAILTGSGSTPRYFSQARQDELVLSLLHNQTSGYFIDLAANDAFTLSNTAALELHFNWTGLCIEPNPWYWYNLSLFRPNCQLVAAVVGRTRDEQVFFRYTAGDHGGIADAGFDNGKRWQRESLPAWTVPLEEILQRNRAPHVIDYLSLDVEGAESFIMMQFPWHVYKIKVITAERLHGDIRRYLQKHGYEFVKRLSAWGESLWVHTSFKHELDMSAVDRFPFPIKVTAQVPGADAAADA